MRCPNCKSEIGSQASCPYCGVVITRSRTYYDYPSSTVTTPRPSRTTMQQDVQSQNNIARRLEKRMNQLELRQTMTMILCGGILALQLLLLIVLIIK